MPASLVFGTLPDWWQIGACMVTLALVLGAFAAIGVFLSALVEEPIVAAMLTFGALLLLKILDWATEAGGNTPTSEVFAYLSMSRHMQPMFAGRFASTDVLYFVILTAAFLALAAWRLEADRLQR